MFKIGDRVIVIENYEGNNTKNQEGVIVQNFSKGTVTILFDKKLKRGHNGGLLDHQIPEDKHNQCWSVETEYVKKIEAMKGEY